MSLTISLCRNLSHNQLAPQETQKTKKPQNKVLRWLGSNYPLIAAVSAVAFGLLSGVFLALGCKPLFIIALTISLTSAAVTLTVIAAALLFVYIIADAMKQKNK